MMNREYRMGKVVRIDDLEIRTEEFALSIIELFTSLPKNVETQIIDKQVLRSGTSVGANYREGCRARSSQKFVAKLRICLQELEETQYWLELLGESNYVKEEITKYLYDEANELMAIFVSSFCLLHSKFLL